MAETKDRKFASRARRKVMNRRVNAEAVREKIAAGITVTQIEKLEQKLLNASLGKIDMTDTQLKATKLYLDAKWKRINTLVPSLKSVEHTGAAGGAIKHHVKVTFHGGT